MDDAGEGGAAGADSTDEAAPVDDDEVSVDDNDGAVSSRHGSHHTMVIFLRTVKYVAVINH